MESFGNILNKVRTEKEIDIELVASETSISKEYKLEIDEVIKNYKERSHKALMRMLIAARKRIK